MSRVVEGIHFFPSPNRRGVWGEVVFFVGLKVGYFPLHLERPACGGLKAEPYPFIASRSRDMYAESWMKRAKYRPLTKREINKHYLFLNRL